MAKRKAGSSEDAVDTTTNRRSSRRKTLISDAITVEEEKSGPSSTVVKTKPPKGKKSKTARKEVGNEEHFGAPKPASSHMGKVGLTNGDASAIQRFWLLKAEPESRFENGHNVKFSIDDLAAKAAPEPWDGIRAYPARNNLRAMKKGDLAFFYHSNCKTPGIAGIMEIVMEHSPDLSAQDPRAAYYDPKDTDASNPKWSVVHVKFRRKFKEPITLKELREFASKGEALENMQMLKQSRLSASGVTKDEWDFLMGVVEDRERE